MSNTTVTITYSNGSTREFVASDELEKLIDEGELFSVTTMHSDISIDEEMSVSKMYAGNPIAALGHMMIMRHNAEKMLNEDDDKDMNIVIETLNACIGFMGSEITSHQSGMSPVEYKPEGREFKKGEPLVPVEDGEKCPAINDYCSRYIWQHDNRGEVAIEHCTHPENSKDEEGNCTSVLCPLCTKGGGS